MRAVAMAEALLHGDLPIAVHGIGLLGQAVNVQETAQRPTNVTGYVAALPLLAAVGHYHGLVEAVSVEALIERAHEFAVRVFAPGLLLGSDLLASEQEEIAQGLEALTGLPKDEWIRRTLRISKEEFRFELLRSEGLVVGRFDARLTSESYDPPRGDLPLDPSFTDVYPHYVLAMDRCLSAEFGLDTMANEYKIIDHTASKAWEWALSDTAATPVDSSGASPFDVFDYARILTKHLRENLAARLFIGTGVYDTMTTVGAVKHLLATNQVPRERVDTHLYPAGHMMYTDSGSASKLAADLRSFIAAPR